jgi:Glycosyltransferase like family
MKKLHKFQMYSVANDAATLACNLTRSPDIATYHIPLTVLWNEASASAAYARAMRDADAEFLIFVHQDVYLPRGWFKKLEREIDLLFETDAEWAVAGLAAVRGDGSWCGHMWDSSLGRLFGGPFSKPMPVASLDELLLIIRRGANVSFDPRLPGFHLYGTDIVLTACAQGKFAYVVDAPAIHNSKPARRVGKDYLEAYAFMVDKWRHKLPWPTLIHPLMINRLPLAIRRLRVRYWAIFRASTLFDRLPDPAAKARELGFEAPQPAGAPETIPLVPEVVKCFNA